MKALLLLVGVLVTLHGQVVVGQGKRDRNGSWTAWSQWTRCSMTCGQGTRSRRRACVGSEAGKLKQLPVTSCDGKDKEHYICRLKACEGTAEDYRMKQCASKNTTPVFRRFYEWEAYLRGPNSCELTCREKKHGFLYNFGKVTDGTPCMRSSHSKDVCLDGHCTRIGCDGRVGSTAVLDNCKVCGGRNHNCIFYRTTYTREYPGPDTKEYSKIFTLPKGAAHIKIEDTSRNYIALSDSDNRYYLNGNLRISRPGPYPAGGTIFNYTMSRYHEVLKAEGPLNKDMNLMYIFRRRNPGVKIQFYTLLERHPDVQNNTRLYDFYRDQLYHRLEDPEKRNKTQTDRTRNNPSQPNRNPNPPNRNNNQPNRNPNPPNRNTNPPNRNPDPTPHSRGDHDRNHGNTNGGQNGIVASVNRTTNDTGRVHVHEHNPGHVYRVLTGRKFIEYRYGGGTQNTEGKRNEQRNSRQPNRNRGSTNQRNNRRRSRVYEPDVPEDCQACTPPGRNKRTKLVDHFCQSDFVIRGLVRGFAIINDTVRYQITVLQNAKSRVGLRGHVYIWVVDRCRCPRLRVGKQFLLMGKWKMNNRESRMELSPQDYVRKVKSGYSRRLQAIAERARCRQQSVPMRSSRQHGRRF